MDVAHLGQRQEIARPLESRCDAFAVDPGRGVGVPLDLEVLGELPVSYCAALPQQPLDLSQDQGVSLDRRRVVSFMDPDLVPDRARLDWRREATEGLAYLADCGVEPLVDLHPGGTATPRT